jgi:hypothetical protein
VLVLLRGDDRLVRESLLRVVHPHLDLKLARLLQSQRGDSALQVR